MNSVAPSEMGELGEVTEEVKGISKVGSSFFGMMSTRNCAFRHNRSVRT